MAADTQMVAFYGSKDDLNDDMRLARNADDDVDEYARLVVRPRVHVADATRLGARLFAVTFRRDPATEFPWREGSAIRLFSAHAFDYVATARITEISERRTGARLSPAGTMRLRIVDHESPALFARFFA